ncbi:hypothetical protein ACWESM_02000 [Nocardia sp. NPDC003999]
MTATFDRRVHYVPLGGTRLVGGAIGRASTRPFGPGRVAGRLCEVVASDLDTL